MVFLLRSLGTYMCTLIHILVPMLCDRRDILSCIWGIFLQIVVSSSLVRGETGLGVVQEWLVGEGE